MRPWMTSGSTGVTRVRVYMGWLVHQLKIENIYSRPAAPAGLDVCAIHRFSQIYRYIHVYRFFKIRRCNRLVSLEATVIVWSDWEARTFGCCALYYCETVSPSLFRWAKSAVTEKKVLKFGCCEECFFFFAMRWYYFKEVYYCFFFVWRIVTLFIEVHPKQIPPYVHLVQKYEWWKPKFV